MDVSQETLIGDIRGTVCVQSIRTSGGGHTAEEGLCLIESQSSGRAAEREGNLGHLPVKVDSRPITQPCLAADRRLMHKPDRE